MLLAVRVCGPEEAGGTDLLGSGGGSGDFA